MQWIWDPEKNDENWRKHRISFDTARLVFDDRLHISIEDPYEDEPRTRTFGMIGQVLVLMVHTWPEIGLRGEELPGRIISARKATQREREEYEERRR